MARMTVSSPDLASAARAATRHSSGMSGTAGRAAGVGSVVVKGCLLLAPGRHGRDGRPAAAELPVAAGGRMRTTVAVTVDGATSDGDGAGR